jgi:cell division protease FtsH
MKLAEYEKDFRALLARAGALLESPVQPVYLAWVIENALERRLIRRQRCGIATDSPMMCFYDAKRGHDIASGVQAYSLEVAGEMLMLAKVVPPQGTEVAAFWVVRDADYRDLYREIRRWLRAMRDTYTEPIQSEETRQTLWDNTIGFLRRDVEKLREYGVPQKRGVLLSGEPGNGKTMACRWLSAQCDRLDLLWLTVTWEEYEYASREGTLQDLFQPNAPGVVLFDDFDVALRNRETHDVGREQTTFLTQMDGMSPKTGVVYLFTSNLKPADLDSAVRRPGRIDRVIEFRRPDAALRSQSIQRYWHKDLLATLDVEAVVAATEGLSFAELEEMKKRLAMEFIDSGTASWEDILRSLLTSKAAASVERRPIGFNAIPGDNVTMTSATLKAK